MTTAASEVAVKDVTMDKEVFPHIKVFCGQPTMASSCLLLTALPMTCWALTTTAAAPVTFL